MRIEVSIRKTRVQKKKELADSAPDRLGTRLIFLSLMLLGLMVMLVTYFHLRKRSLERVHNRCSNIYHWVCLGKGVSIDPSGNVSPDRAGELQVEAVRAKLKRSHPNLGDPEIAELFAAQIYDSKSRNRLVSAYHWTLHALENYLSALPSHLFTDTEKIKLILRLREVKLQVPPPASLYSDDPEVLFQDELFYQRIPSGEMRLRIGSAYLLIARSWFNLIFSFAHELAHVIDPCEMKDIGLKLQSYDRIRECFTDHLLIPKIKKEFECEIGDQISEAFADWLGMEITSEALSYFSTEFHGSQVLEAARNSVRDLCEQEGDEGTLDTQSHPTPHVRIEKIFGRQPIIRQILGCTTYRIYDAHENFRLPEENEHCFFDYTGKKASSESD